MAYLRGCDGRAADLVALFAETFTASEGAKEGRVIGALVEDLLATTAPDDLQVFCAEDETTLTGSILFTRLRFSDPDPVVFLMAPVAVATAHQGKGVGQGLIAHGLDALRAERIDAALTYGDPAFYGRVGFRPIRESDIPAPYPLTHPEGWLGLSLTDRPLGKIAGPAACVAGFRNPALW